MLNGNKHETFDGIDLIQRTTSERSVKLIDAEIKDKKNKKLSDV